MGRGGKARIEDPYRGRDLPVSSSESQDDSRTKLGLKLKLSLKIIGKKKNKPKAEDKSSRVRPIGEILDKFGEKYRWICDMPIIDSPFSWRDGKAEEISHTNLGLASRLLDSAPPDIAWVTALIQAGALAVIGFGGNIVLKDFDSWPFYQLATWKLWRVLLASLIGPFYLPRDIYLILKKIKSEILEIEL